jgi:protein-disulfide isomerase
VKRFVLFLLAFVLAACGPVAPAPNKPDNLVVGKGNEAPIATEKPVVSDEADLPVPINDGDAVKGSRNAYVTIVLFSDFQCPFCSRLVPTLDRVLETHGPDDVRLVFKHNPLPFHDKARPAAEVAVGVHSLGGNEAFWRFHDLVFKNQRDMELPALIRYAREAGVDANAIQNGYDEKRWGAKVDADMELAKKLRALGTPASFINGRELSGAQPFEKFEEIIVAEMEAAKSLVERGVARDKVYGRLVAANFKEKAQPKVDDDDPDDRADTTTVWKVPVGTSPVKGNSAQALVTIVEFGDFQCPYCKRVQPTIDEVKKAYGDKVRIVWKDEPLPFHPRAEPAAQLARFARQQKGENGFWAAHDALFDSQPKLDDSDLEAVAKKIGLDPQKALAAVKAKTFKKQIDDDMSLGDDVQASGTPHFFINGRRIVGAHPAEKFKAIIDEEIKKADALVAKGTSRTALYDTLIKDGKAAPDPEKRTFGPPPANAPFLARRTARSSSRWRATSSARSARASRAPSPRSSRRIRRR